MQIVNAIVGQVASWTKGVITSYFARVKAGGYPAEAPQCVQSEINSQPLLDQASFVLIPSGYKEDIVYSQKPTDGSGDLTFTRASDGTRVNSAGYVENVPWNLALYSEDLDSWNDSNGTSTNNQTISPDGTQNAGKFTPTASSANTRTFFSVTSGSNYTMSVYLKKAGIDEVQVDLANSDFGDANVVVNLTSGTITATGGDNISQNITSVGNEWYLVSLTALSTATNASSPLIIRNNLGYDGSSGFYIWGAQAVLGSTAKPYFPTTDRQNVPRLTYEGGCPSLLLEPQRTNLVKQSEYFTVPPWSEYVFGGASLTRTFGYESPEGNNNAYKFDVVVGTGGVLLTDNITINPANAQTLSVWMKGENGGEKVLLALRNSASAGTSGNIITLTSEWARYDVTLTTDAADRGFQFRMLSSNGVVDQTIYVYGAQLEEGSYATSYIPTYGSSVTRLADVAYKTGISSLIGQTEGTMLLDCEILTTDTQDLLSIRPGGTSSVVIGTASNLILGYVIEGATIISMNFANYAINTRYKIAIAYKNGDCALYVNGTQADTDTTAFTFSTELSTLYLGQSQYFGKSSYKNNEVVLFKTRLTNDQLEVLTGDSYPSYIAMADALNYYYD